MKILGIDNGHQGGMFMICNDVTSMTVMPTITIKSGKKTKTEYDRRAIIQYLKDLSPDHAFIEKAQVFPGQGVVSQGSIMKGYGIMLGILASLDIRETLVHPKSWQKVMFKDLSKSDTKKMAYVVCSGLWPKLDWKATDRCKKFHSGLTDAALIAEYGRRMVMGGGK